MLNWHTRGLGETSRKEEKDPILLIDLIAPPLAELPMIYNIELPLMSSNRLSQKGHRGWSWTVIMNEETFCLFLLPFFPLWTYLGKADVKKHTCWFGFVCFSCSFLSFHFKQSHPPFQTECRSHHCIPTFVVLNVGLWKAAKVIMEQEWVMKAFDLGKGKIERLRIAGLGSLAFFLIFLGDRQIVSYHIYNLLVIALICLLSF